MCAKVIANQRWDFFETRCRQGAQHVRCGQTAGWSKMPLGMEVELRPGDFVLDGDPAPP